MTLMQRHAQVDGRPMHITSRAPLNINNCNQRLRLPPTQVGGGLGLQALFAASLYGVELIGPSLGNVCQLCTGFYPRRWPLSVAGL
jgi:hypothetical protein